MGAGSPVLLALVRLDVVVPPQGVAQVCWGRGREDLKDSHVSLRGDKPVGDRVTMVTDESADL